MPSGSRLAHSATGVPNRQGKATRAELIATAEKLFAEHGVDAVSVRAINTAAGQGAAAVHYHFGTKDGLLTAVLLDVGEQVSHDIAARMQSLADDPHPPTIDDVVRALGDPYLALLQRDRVRGMRWINIVVQVSFQPRAAVRATGQDAVTAALREQVQRALPTVPSERIAQRWPIAVASFLQSVARIDDDALPGSDLADYFDDLVVFVSGGAERMLRRR